MRKIWLSILIMTIMAMGLVLVQPVSAGQAGTTLTANVTLTTRYKQSFDWKIDKSVVPAELNLFVGDKADAAYTVVVTKTTGLTAASFNGSVCVTNTGLLATEGLAISGTLSVLPSTIIETKVVDVSSMPVILPGATACYPVAFSLVNPVPGATYKLAADVTITNHSDNLGVAFGPSPSATVVMPATPTSVNSEVKVTDTNGMEWTVGETTTFNYSKTFECTEEGGWEHVNTARIMEYRNGGIFDTATVKLNCFALDVTKTAETTFDRTWDWTIAKKGDVDTMTLPMGQVLPVNYEVIVSATFTDSAFGVSGIITIANPAPMDAPLQSVTDLLDNGVVGDVVCPALIVPAGGSLECTYSAALSDKTASLNTATAVLINKPTGTTSFTGTAPVVLGGAAKEINKCVDVVDDKFGPLGEVCSGDSPKTFTYTMDVGPYDVCGAYTFVNIAKIMFKDGKPGPESKWTVDVDVPCGGCTLTQGYWKNHSIYGPAAHPNDTWDLVGGPDAPFYLSGQTWLEVFRTAVKGNVYYSLAHQYMAARLNVLSGASTTPEVLMAMSGAEQFFASMTPTDAVSRAQRAILNYYAGILDDYNNGLIGPGHCSE